MLKYYYIVDIQLAQKLLSSVSFISYQSIKITYKFSLQEKQ